MMKDKTYVWILWGSLQPGKGERQDKPIRKYYKYSDQSPQFTCSAIQQNASTVLGAAKW